MDDMDTGSNASGNSVSENLKELSEEDVAFSPPPHDRQNHASDMPLSHAPPTGHPEHARRAAGGKLPTSIVGAFPLPSPFRSLASLSRSTAPAVHRDGVGGEVRVQRGGPVGPGEVRGGRGGLRVARLPRLRRGDVDAVRDLGRAGQPADAAAQHAGRRVLPHARAVDRV